MLKQLTQPALFWLDAGYYGWAGKQHTRDRLDTELNAILSDPKPHIVLIEDAQGFDGQNGAPTLEEFRQQIETALSQRRVEVERQIIRIVPTHLMFSVRRSRGQIRT